MEEHKVRHMDKRGDLYRQDGLEDFSDDMVSEQSPKARRASQHKFWAKYVSIEKTRSAKDLGCYFQKRSRVLA